MFSEPSTSTIHPTIQHYAAAHPEAAGLVTLPGGAQARVRNPLSAALGDAVYVQDGAVIGQAPALPVVVIEI